MREKIKIYAYEQGYSRRSTRIKEIFLFIVWSSVGTITDVILLNILILIGIDQNISNIVSYLVGVYVSFILNRNYNFNTKDKTLIRLCLTTIFHLIGACIQEFIFYELISRSLNLNLAKAITIIENGILMYFASIFIIFRKYKNEENNK